VHKLPLLVSVPHAGLAIPPEVAALNRLTAQEIAEDGDVGAREIYGVLEPYVAAFVISDIARAFVDLNRAEDDIRKDGVIKTHTCWDVPVYERPLSPPLIEALLARYHRPYHERLRALGTAGVIAGVDCHTMAAVAPPEAPDPGQPRPNVCVGDGNGACPRLWGGCAWRSFNRCWADSAMRRTSVSPMVSWRPWCTPKATSCCVG
jgi:N-formylglutamate deformylase